MSILLILVEMTNICDNKFALLKASIKHSFMQGQTRAEWQIVFYVAAAIYFFGAVFYAIFSSGELQSWAQADANSETGAELTVSAGHGENDIMLHSKHNGTHTAEV